MDFDLTREQQNVVERARALAEDHLRPGANQITIENPTSGNLEIERINLALW